MQVQLEEKAEKVFILTKRKVIIMNTKEKIKGFLSKFIKITEINDTDNIFEKGLVNSLFAMNLVNFIETEFDISIDNMELDLDNFKDINSIVALVEKKLAMEETV